MGQYNIEIHAVTKQARKELEDLVKYWTKDHPSGMKVPSEWKDIISGKAKREFEKINSDIKKTNEYVTRNKGKMSIGAMTSATEQMETLRRQRDVMWRAAHPNLAKMQDMGKALPNAGWMVGAGAAGTVMTGETTPLAAGLGGGIGHLFGHGAAGAAVGGIIGAGIDVFTGAYTDKSKQFLKWRGQGYGRNLQQLQAYSKYGYGADETMQFISSVLANRGTMGGGGEELSGNAMKMGRAFGIDTGTMTNIFSSIRQAGGGSYEKKTAEIYASAFATKLERGRFGEYFDEVNNIISQFAAKNVGTDTGQIAKLMGMLTGLAPGMTPAASGRMLNALDASMRNPQGATAPWLLTAMGKTLRQGGYKGNLPLAIQNIQQSGLMGLDLSQFPELQNGPLGNLYKAWNPKNMIGNLANMARGMTKQYGAEQGGLMFSQLATKFMGGDKAAATQLFLAAGRKGGLSEEEYAKFAKKLGPETEKNLTDVTSSIDGTTEAVKAFYEWAKIRFGEGTVPVTTAVKNAASSFLNEVTDRDNVGFGKNSGPLMFKNDKLSGEKWEKFQKTDPALAEFLKKQGDWIVTSLERTEAENAEVGGTMNSAHLRGQAVDLRTRWKTAAQIKSIMENARNAGFKALHENIGTPDDHIHIEGTGDITKFLSNNKIGGLSDMMDVPNGVVTHSIATHQYSGAQSRRNN